MSAIDLDELERLAMDELGARRHGFYQEIITPEQALQLVRRVRAAETMTEQRAREILGNWILPDDSLKAYMPYVIWFSDPEDSPDVGIDGILTADQLEALAWWMRNKKAQQAERGGA